MASRADLGDWVLDAVVQLGGKARIAEVAKHIWAAHKSELEMSGDLFFTWQYDIRWAAQRLRAQGRLEQSERLPKGVWALLGWIK